MERQYPKTFGELLSPIKLKLVLVVALSLLGSLALVLAPVAITKGVGYLINEDRKAFAICIVVAGCAIILRQLLNMAGLGYAHIVEADFREDLRNDFSKKLTRLPLGWFATTSSGEIRKLISSDIIKVHTIIAHGFSEATGAIALPVASIVIMVVFQWQTALMVLGVIAVVMVIGIGWMSRSTSKVKGMTGEFERAQGEMSHGAVEMVDGIKEIKNFGLVKSVFGRFDKAVTNFSQASYDWLGSIGKPMAFVSGAIQPAVLGVFTIGICIFAISKGWLLPEETILFFILATALPASILSLLQLSNFIRDGIHSVETLLAMYGEEDQKYQDNPKVLDVGDIVFDQVSFGYKESQLALENVSCTIPKGKVTALVGPSGGGKTTMARLIARFWDVDQGVLSIGGTNVKDVTQQDLLRAVALVFQDVSLTSGTVAENIALARPEASMEEIIEAAKGACIDERISKLENGYQSVIGEEGVVFSGGEKQRITIARAFLANCPIVILDEATAQADAESEAEIQKALSSLGKGKTVVIIAHRLQTVTEADQILVIDKGQIIERGRHNELVKAKGVYHNMWIDQQGIRGGTNGSF